VYAILLFRQYSALPEIRVGKTRHRQLEALGESGVFPDSERSSTGAIFGLMGLLVRAFTFNGAAGRFEARRDLMTNQINAIGTAYLRLDLLESPAQRAELQDLLPAACRWLPGHHKSVSNPRTFQAATARSGYREPRSLGRKLSP